MNCLQKSSRCVETNGNTIFAFCFAFLSIFLFAPVQLVQAQPHASVALVLYQAFPNGGLVVQAWFGGVVTDVWPPPPVHDYPAVGAVGAVIAGLIPRTAWVLGNQLAHFALSPTAAHVAGVLPQGDRAIALAAVNWVRYTFSRHLLPRHPAIFYAPHLFGDAYTYTWLGSSGIMDLHVTNPGILGRPGLL